LDLRYTPDLDGFDKRGVAIYEHVLSAAEIAAIDAAFPQLSPGAAGARADAFSPEARQMLEESRTLGALAGRLLRGTARLSRLQAFDKYPQANWFVPWHQDRAENGVDRPIDVLARTVALRIHLDDCDENNGPLEVLPGTHLRARLSGDDIAELAGRTAPLLCLAQRGDIVAMRPLIVHRSQRARKPAARRVVHLEYTVWDGAAGRTPRFA
jgi:hypothetical protein